MAEIDILIEGYNRKLGPGRSSDEGTVTLIKSSENIVVDTGNVGSLDRIILCLHEQDLRQEDIGFVVNTHGDLDHVGNNGMFTNATFIAYGYGFRGNECFVYREQFRIDDMVGVIKTPGHTMADVSVIVNTPEGIVAVTGDIFENERDHDGKEARKYSIDWESQLKSRKRLLEMSDYIIPGHGKMFKVEKK